MYSKEHVSYGSYGIRKLTRSLQFTLFWLKTHFEIYPPRYLSSTGKTLRIKFPKWYGQVNDCQSVWTQNTGLTHSFIFQNFVKRINKLNTRAQRNKNSLTSEEGTELRPLWDKCPSGICTWNSFLLLRAVRRINDKAQCGPIVVPVLRRCFCPHCLTTLQY